MKTPPVRIFIVCDEIRDARGLQELRSQLAGLESAGRCVARDRGDIESGSVVTTVLRRELAEADVILVLLSGNLFHNRWEEVQQALAQRARGAIVVPVRYSAVLVEDSDFAGLRMLPADETWITSSKDRAAAWLVVVQGVLRIVQQRWAAKIKLLFLGADPTDALTPVQLDQELQAIEKALEQSQHRDRFALDRDLQQRRAGLVDALVQRKPNFLHFSGHGNKAGALVLLDDQGERGVAVPPVALTDLFGTLRQVQGSDVRFVALSACFSAQQALAIAQHVPCVIGMEGVVFNETCLPFFTTLYGAFADGQPVAVAFQLACAALAVGAVPAARAPQIFYRSDVTPSSHRLI